MFNLKNLTPRLNEPDEIEQSDSEAMRGLCNLYDPEESLGIQSRDVIDVLFDMGKLTSVQKEQIRAKQNQAPGADGVRFLGELGFAAPEDILMARATLYGFEFRRIEPDKVDKDVFARLDPEYIKANSVMPVAIENNTLVIATSKPADVFVLDDIKRRVDMSVKTVICPESDIQGVCQALSQSQLDCSVDEIIEDAASQGEIQVIQNKEQETEDLEKIAGESPIIKFVNYLISHAIREGASDIHIEPKENHTKIRYRIDGILFESMKPPSSMHSAVVSRLKIMSNLDISERRVPQDGRISAIVGGREIDLRVSTLPTTYGEKVVIRILDSRSILRDLDELGMSPDSLEQFRKEIDRPHGIMLVTGPTGSGKTTTLYSALGHMDGSTMNVSTVEDPIEYHLAFTNQVQVNERVGLTFAAALRSLLRQDPDIIMLGEIRDSETARIAVQAALTGHLVLSTLHTNDAPSSITRLVDIGIEPYLISASLNSVLAQRLVRRICPHCKEKFQIPDSMQEFIARADIQPDEIFHGAGCPKCRNSGYLGRLGIYELLVIDDVFRDMITKDSSINNMRRTFAMTKQANLYEDGIRKVKLGLTTLEEVMRVTEASHGPDPLAASQTLVDVPETISVDENAIKGAIKILSSQGEKGKYYECDSNAVSLDTAVKTSLNMKDAVEKPADPIAPAAVKAEESAVSETKTKLLYTGFNPADWVCTMGTWELVDGAYTCTGRGERRSFLQVPVPDNFILTLKATLYTGSGFGIWFRADPNHISGYSFQYDPKWDGGRLILKRWVDNVEYFGSDLASQPYRGQWYGQCHTMKIAAKGEEIRILFDDAELIKTYDSQFASGRVGLRLWDTSDTRFESISIETWASEVVK